MTTTLPPLSILLNLSVACLYGFFDVVLWYESIRVAKRRVSDTTQYERAPYPLSSLHPGSVTYKQQMTQHTVINTYLSELQFRISPLCI